VIPKDELARWKHDEVTKAVIDELEERLDWLTSNMAAGSFFNPSDMHETFGETARVIGEIEGINIFFRVIEGMTDPREDEE
jgi:hypothetical protein